MVNQKEYFYLGADRLDGVAYDVRNPKMIEAAEEIEKQIKANQESKKVHYWNIGNPPFFGIKIPRDIEKKIKELETDYRYTRAQGLPEVIEEIFQYHLNQGVIGLKRGHIFGTDGVSAGMEMLSKGIINVGDEVLIPAPNYPNWRLNFQTSDAISIYYKCDEQSKWYPDVRDIRKKVTPKTKAILVINPNNPTGAVYPREILEQIIQIARENKIIIFSDEIYSEMLYDGAEHVPMASLADDVLIITLNGLSKNRLLPGIRSAWIAISGDTAHAENLINKISLLASSKLCPNIVGQLAIPIVLPRHDYLKELIVPGGRLYDQVTKAHHLISQIPGLSCVKPQAAMYLYVKIDEKFHIPDDEQFVLNLLKKERVYVVQSSGFDDFSQPRHFRVVCLAPVHEFEEGMARIASFIEKYQP